MCVCLTTWLMHLYVCASVFDNMVDVAPVAAFVEGRRESRRKQLGLWLEEKGRGVGKIHYRYLWYGPSLVLLCLAFFVVLDRLGAHAVYYLSFCLLRVCLHTAYFCARDNACAVATQGSIYIHSGVALLLLSIGLRTACFVIATTRAQIDTRSSRASLLLPLALLLVTLLLAWQQYHFLAAAASAIHRLQREDPSHLVSQSIDRT